MSLTGKFAYIYIYLYIYLSIYLSLSLYIYMYQFESHLTMCWIEIRYFAFCFIYSRFDSKFF